MKPLPESFKPGATAFCERMEPQALNYCKSVNGLWMSSLDDEHIPSFAVGERVYLREEWRYTSSGDSWDSVWYLEFRDESKVAVYRDGGKDEKLDSVKRHDWQPASTMPEWVAREVYTVVSVEAMKQIGAYDESKRVDDGCWGWYVTVEEHKP